MRHGQAVHPAVDPKMPLSERGREEVLKSAAHLKESHAVLDAIWHSPKQRALETAQLMAAALGVDPEKLEVQKELVPESTDDGPRQKIEAAARSGRWNGLLIVSHMPFLPRLAAALTGGLSGNVEFETAGILCMNQDQEQGPWRIEWSKNPGH